MNTESMAVSLGGELMSLEEAFERNLVAPMEFPGPPPTFGAVINGSETHHYKIDRSTFNRWTNHLEKHALIDATREIMALDPAAGVALARADDVWKAFQVGTVLTPVWHVRGDRATIVGRRYVVDHVGAAVANGTDLDRPFEQYQERFGRFEGHERIRWTGGFRWEKYRLREISVTGPSTFVRLDESGAPMVRYRILYIPAPAAPKTAARDAGAQLVNEAMSFAGRITGFEWRRALSLACPECKAPAPQACSSSCTLRTAMMNEVAEVVQRQKRGVTA